MSSRVIGVVIASVVIARSGATKQSRRAAERREIASLRSQ
jgi:hypothetical protein